MNLHVCPQGHTYMCKDLHISCKCCICMYTHMPGPQFLTHGAGDAGLTGPGAQKQWVSSGVILSPQGTLSDVWGHLWFS